MVFSRINLPRVPNGGRLIPFVQRHLEPVFYEYDIIYYTTILLEHKNAIYLGYHIEDSLGKQVQKKQTILTE